MRERTASGAPRAAVSDYLVTRYRAGALTILLLLAIFYPFAAKGAPPSVFAALCVVGACLAMRAPRWACYAALVVALLLLVSDYVFTIAVGAQDSQSDRDEAVELAAESLLAGANPWANPTPLNTPITTGPASVLLALPSVLTTHHVDAVSWLFYGLFLTLLCAADLQRRNDTFMPLGLFFLSGFLGIQHALYWSLDELAWAYLVLVGAWWLRTNGWPMGAGACLAFALCSRASYGFPVFAFLCWDRYRADGGRDRLRLATGAALAAALIAAPFVIVARADLIAHNPFTVAGHMLAAPWPDTNVVFRALNASLGWLGPVPLAIVKGTLPLLAIWYGAWQIRRDAPAHPFWHMTFAALLADLLVYPTQLSDDYALFFSVPAFFAVAYSARGFAAAGAELREAIPSATGRRAPLPALSRRRGVRR